MLFSIRSQPMRARFYGFDPFSRRFSTRLSTVFHRLFSSLSERRNTKIHRVNGENGAPQSPSKTPQINGENGENGQSTACRLMLLRVRHLSKNTAN